MRQDCTLLPIQSAKGTVEFVGITIADATDTALFEAQLREALHKIEVISTHDGLTGAFNRRKFDEELIREFSRARRYKAPLSLLLFDLDHFKKINDTYGHQAGDEVLRVVARIAGANLRKSDFFARYGGEEFVIILPSTPQNGCQQVGERLRQAIASTPISWENISINATISVGVTQMRPATENCQALLSEVDKALYASKSNGRNRVTCYRSEEIFYDI